MQNTVLIIHEVYLYFISCIYINIYSPVSSRLFVSLRRRYLITSHQTDTVLIGFLILSIMYTSVAVKLCRLNERWTVERRTKKKKVEGEKRTAYDVRLPHIPSCDHLFDQRESFGHLIDDCVVRNRWKSNFRTLRSVKWCCFMRTPGVYVCHACTYVYPWVNLSYELRLLVEYCCSKPLSLSLSLSVL